MANGKFDTHNQTQMVETTLDLLHALDQGEPLSQRGLAERLGVALGLTNALLKRCAKKGLLKVRNAPAKRYAYYVTPKGLSEKGRLTAEYLSHSLAFYRRARAEYLALFGYCQTRGWENIGLFGASELAEIALIAANEVNISPVGIIDFGCNLPTYNGLPVFKDIADSCQFDALILTDTINDDEVWNIVTTGLGEDRILAPKFLRTSGVMVPSDKSVVEQ